MPILEREPDVYPEGLFELDGASFLWWVAHVRSRQEKVLARRLGPMEIPFYLPLREHKIRRNGRSIVSSLPLFTSYVFFRGSNEVRYQALQTNLIVQVLDVLDQDLLGRELFQLRTLQLSGAPLIPHVYMEAGDTVSITEGPFKGYSGVVLREKGRLRMVVSVSMLRRSVSVELDREALAPAAPRFERAGRSGRAA
jgi:transcriptional antiterminator NusG